MSSQTAILIQFLRILIVLYWSVPIITYVEEYSVHGTDPDNREQKH